MRNEDEVELNAFVFYKLPDLGIIKLLAIVSDDSPVTTKPTYGILSQEVDDKRGCDVCKILSFNLFVEII